MARLLFDYRVANDLYLIFIPNKSKFHTVLHVKHFFLVRQSFNLEGY